MSLFDLRFPGMGKTIANTSIELQTRVTDAIGFVPKAKRETRLASAIGFVQAAPPQASSEGAKGYLITGLPYQAQSQMEQGRISITSNELEPRWTKLVGILFCMPTTKIGKEEIVPHLDYFHHRSRTAVDFFCPGYVRRQDIESEAASKPSIPVGEDTWCFDVAEYDRLRSELERMTSWQYSGETDLLLLEVHGNQTSIRLEFSMTIACNLEQMLKDEAFTSVRAFIEQLVRFGEKRKSPDIAWSLSDHLGLRTGAKQLVEAILGLLPNAARSLYKSSKHFVVRDVSKG
jgi:hypothetical protein